MILNNLIASLLVKDYDDAISFYSGKLGFVVVEDVPMGPDRWVTIALPNSHETVFALHVAKSESDLALVGKQGGSFPFLGITTDDCLGDYQRLKGLALPVFSVGGILNFIEHALRDAVKLYTPSEQVQAASFARS